MTALAPSPNRLRRGPSTHPPQPPSTSFGSDDPLATWKERGRNAETDRHRFEPVWQLCQSFIQNRQWVGWDTFERRIVELPNPDDRERVTVNVLTQYLWTFLGKLTVDDFRPDITFRRDDVESRAYARQARKAFKYGWEEEWAGDEIVMEALLKMAVFGTSGIQCVREPGPVIGQVPIHPETGEPVPGEAGRQLVAQLAQHGVNVEFKDLRDGRIEWRPFSVFNMLTPPGVENERDFPWLILERPAYIPALIERYGDVAMDLVPENLRAIDLVGVREDTGPFVQGQTSGALKDHVRLKSGYEYPTREHPDGQTIAWAGNVKLDSAETLPFTVGRQKKIGVVFFKYHPVPGRFHAIGVVEPGIGPQRQRNRSRSQWIEMKDRAGLGRVFYYKGTITQVSRPKGGVFEGIEVLPGHDYPKETQGVAPGPWIADDVSMSDQDLDKVMGLREVSLGQAPAGVSAYSAFALLAEQDDRRVGPVLKSIRYEIAKLSKITLVGMTETWLPSKQIDVGGEDPDDLLDSYVFDASKLPPDIYVSFGKGAPMPQSQAAEIQKIFDLFDRSISSGQALPLDWLYDSLAAGRAQPLPKREPQMQLDSADMENVLMAHGQPVQVKPYDNDELHVQRHRIAQQALSFVPDLQQIVQLLEQHVQEHLASAQAKQSQMLTGTPQQGATNPGGFGALGGAQAGGNSPLALAFSNRLSPGGGNVRAGQ